MTTAQKESGSSSLRTPQADGGLVVANSSTPTGGNLRRRMRRTVVAIAPSAVWFGAIAAAGLLYWRGDRANTITGYAEEAPVVIAHTELDTVRDVHVRLYEPVTVGQVLVSMDDREERILVAQIEQDIARLRADVVAEEVRHRFELTRAAVDLQDITRQFAADREATRIDYLMQLVQDTRDRIDLRGRETEAGYVRDLFETGNASPRELNAVQSAVESLQAAIRENAEVLDRKRRAFEAADQRWASHLKQDQLETAYDSLLTPLRLAVDVRQRDLENVVRRLDAQVLRSPIDGQVVMLAVRAGDEVQPGTPLITLSPKSSGRVVAYLPEATIRTVAVGTAVRVRPTAGAPRNGEPLSGRVTALSPAVTEAPPRFRTYPTMPVWGRGFVITLEDREALLAGESVQISFAD